MWLSGLPALCWVFPSRAYVWVQILSLRHTRRLTTVIGAGDVEPAHLSLQCGALQAQTFSRTATTGEPARAGPKRVDNRPPLRLVKCRVRYGGHRCRPGKFLNGNEELVVSRQDYAALDEIFEFPDVPGPW